MKKRRRPRKERSPNPLRTLLLLYALASLGYWLAGAMDLWQIRVHWDRRVEAPFRFNVDSHLVESIQPEAKAAGLDKGDRIEGLNGGPYTGLSQWSEILSDGQPGDTLDVEFTRPDRSRKVGTITLDHGPYFYGSTSPVMSYWQAFLIASLLRWSASASVTGWWSRVHSTGMPGCCSSCSPSPRCSS